MAASLPENVDSPLIVKEARPSSSTARFITAPPCVDDVLPVNVFTLEPLFLPITIVELIAGPLFDI